MHVHACVCAYVYVLTYMSVVQVYLIIGLAVQYFQERNRTVYGHICNSREANGSDPQAVARQDSTITCNCQALQYSVLASRLASSYLSVVPLNWHMTQFSQRSLLI